MKILISISKYGPGVYTGKSGLYSAVEPTERSITKLKLLCERAGFKGLEPDLHCTVMYSPEATIPDYYATEYSLQTYKAQGARFRWWEGHDKDGYLVLELASKDLANEHDRLKNLGCEPTFPNYIPHITLKNKFYFKNAREQKMKLLYANLVLRRSGLTLVLNKQKVEDIKP